MMKLKAIKGTWLKAFQVQNKVSYLTIFYICSKTIIYNYLMTRETVFKTYMSTIFYSFVHAIRIVKFYRKFFKI